MKSILILGAGKEQVPAIKRAKQKDIYTIVFDMNLEAEGRKIADEFYPISTRDIDEIIEFLEKYDKEINGVMTIASDIPHIVSAIGERFNLKCIPLEVARTAVNKLRMKKILQKKGVNIPAFERVKCVEDLKKFIDKHDYPVVIKPVDNSGARGVLLINENIDLEWAFNYSRGYSRSGVMIIEKYLKGPQISTEGIMHSNDLYITGFADRNYDKLDKFIPFIIEDGGDSPTILDSQQKQLVNIEFEKAIRGLEIEWGPAKGDMVYSNGKAYVIEIAARLSGGNFCYDHVPLATGVDIVDILIDMAVGNEVNTDRFRPTKNKGVAQRYFFPQPGKIKEIKGIDELKSMPNVEKVDFFLKEGDIVEDTVAHPSRVGYVIATGDNKQEAVYWAEKARERLEFVME